MLEFRGSFTGLEVEFKFMNKLARKVQRGQESRLRQVPAEVHEEPGCVNEPPLLPDSQTPIHRQSPPSLPSLFAGTSAWKQAWEPGCCLSVAAKRQPQHKRQKDIF